MRNHPIFELLLNHLGSLIGLGDAPRIISDISPNLRCSQTIIYEFRIIIFDILVFLIKYWSFQDNNDKKYEYTLI